MKCVKTGKASRKKRVLCLMKDFHGNVRRIEVIDGPLLLVDYADSGVVQIRSLYDKLSFSAAVINFTPSEPSMKDGGMILSGVESNIGCSGNLFTTLRFTSKIISRNSWVMIDTENLISTLERGRSNANSPSCKTLGDVNVECLNTISSLHDAFLLVF